VGDACPADDGTHAHPKCTACNAGYHMEGDICVITPINGGWSAWGGLEGCSVSGACGQTGTRTKRRTCTNPAPKHGGNDCSGLDGGSATNTDATCSTTVCPVDCRESVSVGDCNVSCGTGTRITTRTTLTAQVGSGKACIGTTSASCYAGLCDVDCVERVVSTSGCVANSGSCGAGRRTTTRITTTARVGAGAACRGTTTAACDAGPCPIHGAWGAWGSYGDCSVACGSGTKTRSRSCNDPSPNFLGNNCPGNSRDTASCFAGACCGNTRPIYRSYHSGNGNHFHSVSPTEGPNAGFKDEGLSFRLSATNPTGSLVPLYRCYRPSGDHMYTLRADCEGAGRNEGALGFCSRSPGSRRVALYRGFQNSGIGDHMTTQHPSDFSNGTPAYRNEGITCYGTNHGGTFPC
jgi:hypothetical protein